MIAEKLEILETTQVISEIAKNYSLRILDMLKKDGFDDEEANDMFLTHLAIASERILKQEKVGKLMNDIWTQIVDLPIYPDSVAYCERICANAPHPFSEDEKQYLIMHICRLITAKEEVK